MFHSEYKLLPNWNLVFSHCVWLCLSLRVCLSVFLCVYVSLSMWVSLSVCVSISMCVSVIVQISLTVCLTQRVFLSICVSLSQCVCVLTLCVSLSHHVHVSLYICVYLSVCLCVSLNVCLYVSVSLRVCVWERERDTWICLCCPFSTHRKTSSFYFIHTHHLKSQTLLLIWCLLWKMKRKWTLPWGRDFASKTCSAVTTV